MKKLMFVKQFTLALIALYSAMSALMWLFITLTPYVNYL